MSNFEKTKQKLLDSGFLLLSHKENIVFYKISKNNIDLVISKKDEITRFTTINKNKIESIHIINKYLNISMSNGIEYKFKEIEYKELDLKLLEVLIDNTLLSKKSSVAL